SFRLERPSVRKDKTLRSAEKQTPITPLAISQFRARGPQGRGPISLAQNPEPTICVSPHSFALGDSGRAKITTAGGPEPPKKAETVPEVVAAYCFPSSA